MARNDNTTGSKQIDGKGRLAFDIWNSKDFMKSLRQIGQRGALGFDVVGKVQYAIGCWKKGEDPQLQLTHFGESRIPHVVKYDLPGRFRLVSYEHAGKRILLYIGNHEEAERWLESHRGFDFSVSEDRRISYVPSEATADGRPSERRVPALPTASGPLIDRLPPELVRELGLSESTLKLLARHLKFETVHEAEAWELIEGLAYPADTIKVAVREAMAFVASGQMLEAIGCLNLALGRASTASDDPGSFVEALESGDNSDVLAKLSDLTEDQWERACQGNGLTDWMLFLHPDQKKFVNREFQGPARLVGVSGSGKTSVLVHRAVHLSQKYKGERILVLCLNPSLRFLIDQLINQLAPKDVRDNIRVRTVYEECYGLAKRLSPDGLIERHDPRSGEDLTKCWSDFVEKPHATDIIAPVVAALSGREDKVDPLAYLLDELIWIRSGFGLEEREEYLVCERSGRGIPFPKYIESMVNEEKAPSAVPFDTRKRVLELLVNYEEYMADGGLQDDDGVSQRAFSLRERIVEHPLDRARCVLVDEYQDCSTLELAVIAAIPTNQVDGLFLCGDPVQKVLPKQHELARAGIDIKGRGVVLRKNYRNSRQILEAAFTLIRAFKDDSPLTTSEVLEPEFAVRDGSRPSLYECDTIERQLDLVFYLLDCFDSAEWGSVCVCSARTDTLSLFERMCSDRGLQTQRLTGEGEPLGKHIKTSTFEDIKGYEFSKVFILDLSDAVLPRRVIPYGERWRDAFHIYVAMTRARDELVMTFVYNRSILLGPLQDTVHEGIASDITLRT